MHPRLPRPSCPCLARLTHYMPLSPVARNGTSVSMLLPAHPVVGGARPHDEALARTHRAEPTDILPLIPLSKSSRQVQRGRLQSHRSRSWMAPNHSLSRGQTQCRLSAMPRPTGKQNGVGSGNQATTMTTVALHAPSNPRLACGEARVYGIARPRPPTPTGTKAGPEAETRDPVPEWDACEKRGWGDAESCHQGIQAPAHMMLAG